MPKTSSTPPKPSGSYFRPTPIVKAAIAAKVEELNRTGRAVKNSDVILEALLQSPYLFPTEVKEAK